jgi:NAD(P)-dependent dehydrogenase (short-subunit alcohol dehydrogenase family)
MSTMPQPLFDLTGKRALITGATKGIGRAIAEAFVDHGATVAITSRDAGDAADAARAIDARAGRKAAIGVGCDLDDLNATLAAFDEALDRLGAMDVLICNAAATPSRYGAAADLPIDEYEHLLQTNIVHNLALMNRAATHMKERGEGVILVTSSGAGMRPAYGMLPYGVAKAGLNHAVRSLGAELAPFNIRVNAIAPGMTRSWSLEEEMKRNPEVIERYARSIPLGRIIEPEEIAAGMVFLASTGGRSITGQVIVIDGGEPGVGRPSAD